VDEPQKRIVIEALASVPANAVRTNSAEHNRESTARQYALAGKACKLGWAKEQVAIVDEDLGLSGAPAARLKRTMSEAELHIVRAQLDGGIRYKAARGELRRGLPVGLVWGEQDGEILFHPDAAQSRMHLLLGALQIHHHFFQQRAQEFFAVAIRDSGRGPDWTETGAEELGCI
jgi:pimeloyl-ACP methyl ester carboxylesterase